MDYRHIFRDLRISRNIKQQDIAELCGVSAATVGHWENCRRDMRIDCIVKLCRFYNISSDYILGINESMKEADRGDLSADEITLISDFRSVLPEERKMVSAYLKGIKDSKK